MTRQVALIGKPLKRRHSQVMHDTAFHAAGIDGRYVLCEIDADQVAGVVRDARGDGWLGLGVTAPYKQVVAGLVDEVEGDAQTIGAVNNVVRTDDGRLIGFNSDAPGFRAGVELAMGRSLDGANVVVAGAGGAAHAVVFALLSGGAKRVTVAPWSPDYAGAHRAPARLRRYCNACTPATSQPAEPSLGLVMFQTSRKGLGPADGSSRIIPENSTLAM